MATATEEVEEFGPPVQFMMRVKLPSLPDGRDICLPDISDDREYKSAIFAQKPWGFEVNWHLQPWPKDKEGYTYVPLFLSNNERASQLDQRNVWVNRYYKLCERIEEINKQAEKLMSLTKWYG